MNRYQASVDTGNRRISKPVDGVWTGGALSTKLQWTVITLVLGGSLGFLSFMGVQAITADARLESTVETRTGLERGHDEQLARIADQRATEVQADWSHAGQVAGTFEVLAFNRQRNPIARAVEQWAGSPTHWAILVDTDLTRIGCASDDGQAWTVYVVCVLAP